MGHMVKKRTEKESGRMLLAGIKEEMAKPRITKSARESEMMLATSGIMKRKCGKAKP